MTARRRGLAQIFQQGIAKNRLKGHVHVFAEGGFKGDALYFGDVAHVAGQEPGEWQVLADKQKENGFNMPDEKTQDGEAGAELSS